MRWPTDIPTRALGLSVAGAVLVLAGIALMAITARSLLDYRQVALLHGGEIADLGSEASPSAGQHGVMARVTGTPRVVEAPFDAEFNQRVDTPLLVRHVEMFQWREIAIGGRVSYEMDWVDHPVDSGRFAEPHGHLNPVAFPLTGQAFEAGLVQLGGFRLDPVLQKALPGSEPVTPDAGALPLNLRASFSPWQDYLVTSAQPGHPRLGDLRVSWTAVPPEPVTIVGRLDGARLVAAGDAGDGKGYVVVLGDVPTRDIFPDLPAPPTPLWTRYLLAILLTVGGVALALAARQPRFDLLLAIGLGVLVIGALATALWLGHDMLAALRWLLIAVAGGALTGWRLHEDD